MDDSDIARRALAGMLDAAGFQVEVARSACEAESLVDARGPAAFDVILMELHMPDGTGIVACARIKGRARWQDIPVIVVTGSDDDRDLTLAFFYDSDQRPLRDVLLRVGTGADRAWLVGVLAAHVGGVGRSLVRNQEPGARNQGPGTRNQEPGVS